MVVRIFCGGQSHGIWHSLLTFLFILYLIPVYSWCLQDISISRHSKIKILFRHKWEHERQHKSRIERRGSFCLMSKNRIIDPLDGLMGDTDAGKVPMSQRNDQYTDTFKNAPLRSTSDSIDTSESYMAAQKQYINETTKLMTKRDHAFDSFDLEAMEANTLRDLPRLVLQQFKEWLSDAVFRIAASMLTVHVMTLIPTLRYIYFDLQVSIYPYLYIGPILFSLPFIIAWGWDGSLIEVVIIDKWLMTLLIHMKEIAVLNLSELKKKFVDAMRLDMTQSEISERAEMYARALIFSNVDPEALFREIKDVLQRQYETSALSSSNYLYSAISIANSISKNGTDIAAVQQLEELQTLLVNDDEKELTSKVISTIEASFDKAINIVDSLQKRKNSL